MIRLGLVLSLLLLSACARFGSEPRYLTFPDEPSLTWALCELNGGTAKVCLSQSDAQKLAKWIDKLRAFEHARERLINR